MLKGDGSSGQPIVTVQKGVIRKKVTARDIEKWEVAQLDFNIAPLSKPSDLFERLEEKRRIRHENQVQQLARSLYEVNLKTEKNIKISSEELKAHAKEFRDTLEQILSNINKPEVTSYCVSVFTKLQDTANEFKSQQQCLVNELHQDLMKFEDDRAKENEKILRLACEEIRKIGYFLPYEVQTFVEHETLKMNKLSLNNRRCYEDLKLTLTLVTEQTFKSFMDKVYCIRHAWSQHKSIDRYYTDSQNTVEKTICKIIPEACIRLEVQGQELSLRMMSGNMYSTCKGQEWLENVEQSMATISSYGENLISVYKKVLKAIYDGFDNDTEEIWTSMTLIERLTITERTIQPIVFNAPLDQIKELEDMEYHWQDTLDEIRLHLRCTEDFLPEVRDLWDRHLGRIRESKKLILKALEKSDSTNQAVFQDLEIKLNISLDALRQEHIESKLEREYEAVVASLDLIKVKYESVYIEDVSTVEDFYKMMDLEADVLSADIREFIYEIEVIDHGSVVHCYTEQMRFHQEGKPIYKEMKICCQKIQAIKSWKQGIWVALETLSGKTKESLAPRAESWIAKKIESLAEKKSLQLELLDKRYKRVQIEIYEKRLEEIKHHQQLLEKHKEKVEIVLKQMKEGFQDLLAAESTKLNRVAEDLAEIHENAILENRPGIIRGNQIMLERKKEELEDDLKMTFERFRARCSTEMYETQQMNVIFMKSIKLFHENGNYSSEEAKTYIGILEEMDREITTEFKNILKDSSKEENEFVRKGIILFSPVLTLFASLFEETLFNQEVQQRLRSFSEEIRELTKTLMLDFEFLNQQCYCLCKAIKGPTADGSDTEEKFWNFVIELLYRNVRNLVYPLNLPETPAQSEMVEGSQNGESDDRCCSSVRKFSVNTMTPKTIPFRTSEKEKPLTCKDYRDQLFNCKTPPENDGSFMAVICNNFWNETDFLQRAACEFYKKIHLRKIIREDLIPNNYDMFVNHISTKFKYYYVQIQQFWLQMLLDFLHLLGRIKSWANYYLGRKLDEYKNAALKSLENIERDFTTCIEAQMCQNAEELEDLDTKLRPLHGYPHNVDLLNELEEEVVRRTANQKIEWESVITKFKNQLKCFRIHHVLQKVELNKIGMCYLKLRDTIFVEGLSNDLLDVVYEYCDNGRFCIKKIPSDDSTLETFNEEESLLSGDVPEEHKLEIDPSKKKQAVHTYLEELKRIIERERLSDDKPSKCPPCPEDSDESYAGKEDLCVKFCEKKLNILLEVMDFDQPVDEILGSLHGYVRKLTTLAKSQEKFHEEELYNWLDKWKFNVKKVLKLYRVMYEEKGVKPEEDALQRRENSKAKTEKTSASVTSTVPRLCPTTKLKLKHTSYNTPRVKSQFPGNKAVSNEHNTGPGVINFSETNFQKSITQTENSDRRLKNNILSPRNYHGHIPVLSRHSFTSRMSPPVTRSPSPLKKGTHKEKSTNKIKTITLDGDIKKKTKTHSSRSPSPAKQASSNYKKQTSRSSTSPAARQRETSEKMRGIKRPESSKQARTNSPSKRKSKTSSNEYSLNCKSGREWQTLDKDSSSIVLKQTSQPSLHTNEKIIQPHEKISLDHIKNEVFTGDHRRLSLEKVHLCIEQTMENFNVAERKRSYLVRYSSEDIQNQEEISLSFLQNMSRENIQSFPKEKTAIANDVENSKAAIRTLSGHELVLTPSMKLDVEREEVGTLEISEILQGHGETFDDNTEVHILQDDDENEYDSEVSTDGEMARRGMERSLERRNCNDRPSANALWKSREADFLNDVDYRQSVYHPAVSRRQKTNSGEMEFRPKSKSIEDNFGFPNKTSKRVVRSRSSNLNNKYASECFTTNKMDICNNERSWARGFDKTDERPIYNSVIQDVPYFGMKRTRTKKERISGAILRFTLKIIRLLAIFNLWPGDNCHMLTSQSLRFAR